MRCIDPAELGREEDDSPKTVSVIAGDMRFASPLSQTGSLDREPDNQEEAFREAMKFVSQIRSDSRMDLGNVLFMFDQKGSWEGFFKPTSRKLLKKRQLLPALNSQYSTQLLKIIEQSGLPSTIADLIEAVPEEKLKFLFLKLAKERGLSPELLLQNSMVIPKEFSRLERGALTPLDDDEDGDEDESDKLFITGVSCSVEPDDQSIRTYAAVPFEDMLARCRAVAAALTIRASTLHDLENSDEVHAFYQFDPLEPLRVSAQVVTDGAAFAQKYLGLSSSVFSNYFVRHSQGYNVTTYLTKGGDTSVISKRKQKNKSRGE